MSNADRPLWQAQLATLSSVQIELQGRAPYRDFGLIPQAGASGLVLRETEQRLGRRLPTSYRAFLRQHDGWNRFYDGCNLLGCQKLQDATLQRTARQILSNTTKDSAPKDLLVFGVDPAATTLFAFDFQHSSAEPAVLAWLAERPVKYGSFLDFLVGLTELCSAELLALTADREPLRKAG